MNKKIGEIIVAIMLMALPCGVYAQAPKSKDQVKGPDLQWFREAKFGMFIHWGLYSQLAGRWKGVNYYGSGEWLMNRAKIPAAEYAETAKSFNPVYFNADQWAQIAKSAGVRYMVITAKHHEGFSMFHSKVSKFNIVDATPFKRDPMKELSAACRKAGIRFGCYYSQFLDWHEPNGGGNTWDFDGKKKNYQEYYREKAIPQLKELLSNYGPLGIVWFDMPGGLSKEQTEQMIDSLRLLQPGCLFSSRVGQGLGDYRDFGDSEIPSVPIKEPWEAIFTGNDSWGYVAHDMNFKSAEEIIHLLANIASKGGNLMLNVGPDGKGRFPPYEVKYLEETGKWLQRYGESIYGTTYGLIPPQPWGVTTSKPGKLYLHIFRPPANGILRVPFIKATVKHIRLLSSGEELSWKTAQGDILIRLPGALPDSRDAVLEMDYAGVQPDFAFDHRQTISRQFPEIKIPVIQAGYSGQAKNETITSSRYFGDWKHDNCAVNMKDTADEISFDLDIAEPGDYRVILDYACSAISRGQEGIVRIGDQKLQFLSLETGEYNSHKPLLFIQHPIGIITIRQKGAYRLQIRPYISGTKELFRLRNLIIQPVQ